MTAKLERLGRPQRSTDSYYAKDGMLICKDTGKEHIFTEKEYAIHPRLEIRLDKGSNNGLGIRDQISASRIWKGTSSRCRQQLLSLLETRRETRAQRLPIPRLALRRGAGKRGALKEPGEWNQQEVVCDGRHLKVTLNGQVILDCDLDAVQPIDGHEHPGLKYAKADRPACPRQLRRRSLLPHHADQGTQVDHRGRITRWRRAAPSLRGPQSRLGRYVPGNRENAAFVEGSGGPRKLGTALQQLAGQIGQRRAFPFMQRDVGKDRLPDHPADQVTQPVGQ